MSVLTLNVDEVMRTLSAESSNPFVVHDKEVDIVRFAINSGFADIVLDGQVALRVMYQRPGETEVRAQTLTYYDTDGLHNYYDWQLAQSDLAKDGSLMVALCILDISGGEVSEWHTTPCAVRVLSTIHTDDSDEGDDTITPTVRERVAVLESMIQRVASGAPIVVASTSAMTDTDQIYVLSTDGTWYYHNGSAWVVGGEYGAVATDTTLTQSGIPADAKTVGDAVSELKSAISSYITWDYPLIVAKWTTGKYLTKTGSLAGSYPRQQYTEDYYPVRPGMQFYTTCVATGNAAVAVYYNANKTVVTGVNRGSNDSHILTVPDNDSIAYVRFSSEYTGYTKSIPKITELDEGSEIAKLLLSKFTIPAKFETGKRLNTDGTTTDSVNSRYTPDFYPVYPNEVLDVNLYASRGSAAIIYYDKDKQIVSFVNNTTLNGTVTVPDNNIIRYAKFSTEGDVVVGRGTEKAQNHVEDEIELYADIDELRGRILNIPYEYPITWTSGGFVNSGGSISSNANYEYSNFINVYEGQKLDVALYATGVSDVAALFFTEQYKVVSGSAVYLGGRIKTIDVPAGAVYARFSNKLNNPLRYVRNHGNSDTETTAKYFVSDADTANYVQTLREFVPKTDRIEHKYTGEVSPKKRFLAFGFDDLRESDMQLIMPLFAKYGGKALFNVVTKSLAKEIAVDRGIAQVLAGDHELGDHTFLHYSFPYFNPLWNGQDPASPDGNQSPCPTNDDFRSEYADGKNRFGYSLTATATVAEANVRNTTWANLTDAQCQAIRDTFSVMKNSSLITILDTLSNEYLGTTGNSAGSWDSTRGEYTGGIYTGMKTSENHEVWERILTVMQIKLKDQYGVNYEMKTWSRPGSYGFDSFKNSSGNEFYDRSFTVRTSPQSKIASSLYKTETGAIKTRSWTDVLREFGYRITHDYPGQQRYRYVGKQFYMNESGKKKDAVPYPSDYQISFSTLQNEYPESFFTDGKTKAAQMFDASGSFRDFIGDLRHQGANGHIKSEMIDSYNTYSFKVFFENVLRFCQKEGFELITKSEAYDIAFNHNITNGNLLYNPELKNSLEDFFTDATNVPTNPDGYSGSCSVEQDENVPVLVTTGETIYTHYGIPYGDLNFKCKVKGTGTIRIYAFRNNDSTSGALSTLDLLDTINVSNADEFTDHSSDFTVLNAPMEQYDVVYEGYAQKIVGIKIVFSTGLKVKKQVLNLLT